MATTTLGPPTLRLDVTLKQSADATITLTVVDGTGAPINPVTGYTVRAQIRLFNASPVLFEWNTTPGPGIGTATIGFSAGVSTVVLTISGAQSALLPVGGAQWDCFLTSPAGRPSCIAEGLVTVIAPITH